MVVARCDGKFSFPAKRRKHFIVIKIEAATAVLVAGEWHAVRKVRLPTEWQSGAKALNGHQSEAADR